MSTQATSIDLTSTTTTPLFQLGGIHIDTLGRKWQYVKGAGTSAQYDYVNLSLDGTSTATGMTTTTNPSTAPAAVGCIQAVGGLTASLYGWVIRSGVHTGNVSAATAINVKLYTTATAGKVSSTATTLVNGLTATVATGAAGATTMYASLDMATAAA